MRDGRASAITATPAAALVSAALLTLSGLAYDPLAEAAEPKRALGLCLAAVCVAVCIASPPRFRCDPRVAGAGIGFLALSSISSFWGLPAGARDLGTLFVALGSASLGGLLGPVHARSTARLAALAMGGLAASFALVSALRGVPAQTLHAGQGNPNWLGLLLAVTLPLSLDALFVVRRAPLACRALAFSAGVVQMPALYLSHSRVAWFSAGVATAVLLFAARRHARARGRELLVGVGVVALLATLAARSPQDVPVERALAGRVWIWEHSARAAARAFPLGAGLGKFGHAYLDAQGLSLRAMTEKQAARRFANATTAHNEYLQAAVESGVISALLLGATLLFGAHAAARQRWVGGAAALTACFLTALGDSPLRQPAVASLIGLVLGTPSTTRGVVVHTFRARLARGVALLLIAASTRAAVRGWLGTRERTSALEGEFERRVPGLMRSARLDPGSGETQLELGLTRLRAGEAAAALGHLERADMLFADTATRIAIGQAELELSRTARATRAFQRALAWNFGSFRAHLGLAEAHLRAQRLEDAEREASIARDLLPGAERGRELLDRIHEAQMDR